MIWMTGLRPWAEVSFSPAGLSGVDMSGIGVVQEIQNLPHYSDESKIKQKKICEKNPLTNKVCWFLPIEFLYTWFAMHLSDLSWGSMSYIIHLKNVLDCESWSKWSQTRIIQWLLLSLLLKTWNHTFMFLFKSCHEWFVQGSLGRRSNWIQVSMTPAQCHHFLTILLAQWWRTQQK